MPSVADVEGWQCGTVESSTVQFKWLRWREGLVNTSEKFSADLLVDGSKQEQRDNQLPYKLTEAKTCFLSTAMIIAKFYAQK